MSSAFRPPASDLHRRLVWLDGWRIVAASLVFLTHYKPITGSLHALADEGHIGVSLFFVISGMVLSRQLWQEAPGDGLPVSRVWWRGFYRRRFAKIYLLHTALYLLCLPLIADSAFEVAANLTLTKALFTSAVFSGLPQSWSLTVELMLYALLPLLAWLGRRKVWLPLTLSLALALAASTWFPYAALYSVAGRAFAFCLGMAMMRGGRLEDRGENVEVRGQRLEARGERPEARVSLGKTLPFALHLALSAIALAGALLALGTLAPDGFQKASTDSKSLLALAANTIAIPLILAALISFTKPNPFNSNLSPLTSNLWPLTSHISHLTSLLGRASYAFYLIHVGPLGNAIQFLSLHNNLLTYALLWGFSLVVHLSAEYPVLQILSTKGAKR